MPPLLGRGDHRGPQATRVPFEGTPDARLAGSWKSPDGHIAYDFTKDGRYTSETNTSFQGRPMSLKLEGEWRVDGDRMLFRDKSGAVVPYAMALGGDDLTLTSVGTLKNKTVLKRR